MLLRSSGWSCRVFSDPPYLVIGQLLVVRVVAISHLFLLTLGDAQLLLLEVQGAAEFFLTLFILRSDNWWLSESSSSAIFLTKLGEKQLLLLEVDGAGRSLRILLLSSSWWQAQCALYINEKEVNIKYFWKYTDWLIMMRVIHTQLFHCQYSGSHRGPLSQNRTVHCKQMTNYMNKLPHSESKIDEVFSSTHGYGAVRDGRCVASSRIL